MSEGRALLLQGAIVQRVDVGPRALVLRVRAPGETRFVIMAAGRRGRAVGLTAGKPFKVTGLPGGSAPEGEKMRLRARLEGARVEAVGPRWIALARGDERTLVQAGDRIAVRDAPPGDAMGADAATAEEDAAWLEAGEQIARELGEGAAQARQQDLARAVARGRGRVGRRIEAIRGDLARIAVADAAAARAALFVAAAARARRGGRAPWW